MIHSDEIPHQFSFLHKNMKLINKEIMKKYVVFEGENKAYTSW